MNEVATDINQNLPVEENLRDKVLAALKTVYDPEIPVDIYELGLIYEINVFPVNNVFILMTLTSPSCPSAEAIPSEVEQKVKAIEGVNDVKNSHLHVAIQQREFIDDFILNLIDGHGFMKFTIRCKPSIISSISAFVL